LPEIGPIAEVFAALFTGATAFLIWRGMQPLKPEIETEVLGPINGLAQVSITVHNHDQRFTLTVADIKADALIDPFDNRTYRARPGEGVRLVYNCRGPEAPKKVVLTMRFANRRAKHYQIKLTRLR
jgi:hypothetical protein